MDTRRSRSVGEVALRSQLDSAQQKINSLEVFIRDRERHHQTSGGGTRGHHGEHSRDSITPRLSLFPPGIGSQRRRRHGRINDTLMTLRSLGTSIDEEDEGLAALKTPLGEFVCLKLARVLETDDMSTPFILRRLIGREYHIGPDKITIGTSLSCNIRLPVEGDILTEHCCIKYIKSSQAKCGINESTRSHFILEDLTGGLGATYITHENGESNENKTPFGTDDGRNLPAALFHGARFITGKLVWDIVALPADLSITAKLFYLAEHGDLSGLKCILEPPSPTDIPKLTVTGTDANSLEFTLPICLINQPTMDTLLPDINTDYHPPIYEDDEKMNILLCSSRKGSERISVITPISTSSRKDRPSLLLHIAVSNGDMTMAKYFLDKGADVNKCSGTLQYTAVHLAASLNDGDMMSLLIQYGADLEIRNIENFLPLALTSSYEIRKMILNSVLLCAAADAGDIAEVTRLLATSCVSPSVKGLRHKSPLHLAAFQGHSDILELLIINGANVNQKGGSRQRTPLHYASQGGHSNCIQTLLSGGAQEFSRDIGGYTPLNLCKGDACRLLNKQPLSLCLAVQSGNVDSVLNVIEGTQLPFENDEEMNIIDLRNENGHAPLHLASIMGSLLIAQVLVSSGATVDITGGSENWTPLFYAAMAGHIDLVEFFLTVGADPEACDKQGSNVREIVKKEVDETVIRMNRLKKRERSESVVEANVLGRLSVNMLRQVSSPSCSVESELIWQREKLDKLYQILPLLTSLSDKLTSALDSGNIFEFISILDSNTIDKSLVNDIMLPILVQACEDGLARFVTALLDHGLNPCTSGPSDEIPLLVAAKNGQCSVLKLLIEKGVSVNTQSSDTLSSALHEAAYMNMLSTVNYLLSVGADRDLLNSSGEKPFDCTKMLEIQQCLATGPNQLLVAACTNDSVSITKLVTSEGIDVDSQFYRNGYTALHQACEQGYMEVVKTLSDLGASVNIKGGDKQSTPLHVVSECDHLEIAKLLLTKGAAVDIKNIDGKVPFEVAISNKMRKVLVESRQIKPVLQSGSSFDNGNAKLCLICMDNPINTIILPCGHQSFCLDCVTQLTECALDRNPIREIVSVYK